jgi:uroporphyrinogen-III decarboxylase
MNSKERVQACIDRRPTDAVPLGFYLVDHDTISKVIGRPTYVRNNVATNLAYWDGRRDEVVESMKADVVDFYRKIDLCDIITFKEACIVPPKGYQPEPVKKIADDCWEDAAGRVYQISAISNEFVCVKNPTIQDRVWTREEFLEPLAVSPPDPSIFEVYDVMVAKLSADRYVAGATAGFGLTLMLGGMERGLIECALNPEAVHAAMHRQVVYQNAMDDYYLRPGLGGAFIESDMSSTRATLISPAMWRALFRDDVRARIASLRARGLQVLMHSCGNTLELMEEFIDAGVQCYQSIQNIPEMWVGDLKQRFGDRLVLWGGMPVEELVLGTPDSVRAAVRRALEAAAPGGGFILGPSHSVAYGTTYENFMALLDEFSRLRHRFAG